MLWGVVETRPRVVIIGGGMAGVTAAWRLSDSDWRARFSTITVVTDMKV
jgi:cation diffusion facilitator CzcD-associated flavoprotein CzcO